MIRLPIHYFESRKTGSSTARVKELESIRSFFASSTISAVIDLFFIVVFIGFMWYYNKMLTCITLGAMVCYALLSLVICPIFKKKLEKKEIDKLQRMIFC